MGVHHFRRAIGTSTGNVDLVSTTNSGSAIGTPIAAMLFLNSCVTTGTEANHNLLAIGFTDGTNHRCQCVTSENGVATTNTWNKSVNDSPLISINANTGAIDGAVDTCSFITDGIRLHVSDAFPASYFVDVVLWVAEGSGYDVVVGDFQGSVDTSKNLGFGPDQLFTTVVPESVSSGFTGISTTSGNANNAMSFGFVDGTVRRCFAWYEEDGYAAGGGGNHSHSAIDQGLIAEDLFGGSMDVTLTRTGFDISASDGYAAYLAINYRGNNRHTAGDNASPTSTGSQSITGLGFQPHFILEIQSSQHTAYTTVNNSNGWAYGIGIASNNSESSPSWDYDHSIAGRSLNTANPTVTKGRQGQNSFMLERNPDNSGTLSSTFTSFDSDGYTKNWAIVLASSYKGCYIAVGPPCIPVKMNNYRQRRN